MAEKFTRRLDRDRVSTGDSLSRSKPLVTPPGAQVVLIEAEDTPGLSVSINPPGFFASIEGAWASMLVDCSSSDADPAFQESGWSLTVDVGDWFVSSFNDLLFEETDSAYSKTLKRLVGGRIKAKAGKCKLRFAADLKDQFVATGFHFATVLTFTLMAGNYLTQPLT